ncbi:phosphoglucosamine mutase [Arachidicoccus soli]|uniref:Phosphoglucosamine mutase n=1 Tax=Arachidicoccus soli TaxID=2341117 RepID=A0A386HT99_9BACT|nr:phosphoglucosamine mutase [Arachidicoccus soli]AYD48630.1 phosphoglucosamine mutase [Arachidicoccus soli]
MSLIKSISGIRGTIGGKPGETLSPLDVVKFTAAYGTWIKQNSNENYKIVVGRDGRMSGEMVQRLVVSTLNAVGLDVIDVGLSTTPTVEMAVIFESAAGGIILTASHNPKEWNALKLLNEKGEFINAEIGKKILEIAAEESFDFVPVDKLGSYAINETVLAKHIDAVVKYPLVKADAIKRKGFKIVIDAINSTGAIAVPELLRALGVEDANIIVLNEEVNGKFAHNPEPLPEHLNSLRNEVKQRKADLGIAVDPDVDRLCFVCEDGSLFGEEYTLVAVADYILQHKKGNTVSNMSSTRALRDITENAGGEYFASAVGEVNVVNKMKAVNAVIGGEGNGGIIVPDLHYGRDALIGIALFLSLIVDKKSVHHLRNQYPNYFISKNKIELENGIDTSKVFGHIISKYKNNPINKEDGLKIEFDKDWVHLRTSNTEPIVRIYAESSSPTTAENIAKRIMQDIKETM